VINIAAREMYNAMRETQDREQRVDLRYRETKKAFVAFPRNDRFLLDLLEVRICKNIRDRSQDDLMRAVSSGCRGRSDQKFVKTIGVDKANARKLAGSCDSLPIRAGDDDDAHRLCSRVSAYRSAL
jgi:hypothetical protein